ncbi:NACHT domain-containing protein [Streptomyces sp. NPDC058953]|uniref:NACHT domain-containing protein n=1 Tax=unclassified Streptomyces TaxID=2593676 RepID=UPI0036B29794
MRPRWALTWLACAVLTIGLSAVWARWPQAVGNAGSVVGAAIGLFGVMAVWAWRRGPRHGRSASGQVAEAAELLARLVRSQWEDEAVLRQLFDPAPLPVLWTDCPRPGVSDHRQLIGGPVTCRADAPEELAAAFRGLARRRLVALGPAGSGKTTLAVLLTLALLRDRDPDEPVPVLLSLASFDPARDSVRGWLRRRIAADYPALADVETFGPSAIGDLLADGRILPVLDGLDERPEPGRAEVLTALNDTLDPRAPLVLTCRTDDYTAAVADAGVLTGAAVITPAPVRPGDALALLRLATPPGPRQRSWDELAAHVGYRPAGPAARMLTNPLMVSLARSVYADAPGDPAELTDDRRFPDTPAVEHHLLDAYLPTLYGRARRRDPAGCPWGPRDAHRYFGYLAARLEAEGTYDFAWWRLYRWVPAASRPAPRALLWGLVAILLSVPLILPMLIWQAEATILETPELLLNVPLMVSPWVVALICVQLAGARLTDRTGNGVRRGVAVGVSAVCGGAAGCAVVYLLDCVLAGNPVGVEFVLRCLCWISFALLMVLLSAGEPTPPELPSQGTFTLRHWRRRLPSAAITVAVTAALGAATLQLYGVIETYDVEEANIWRSAVPFGLAFGAAVGIGQAALRWTRDTVSADDLTTAVSSVRADRLVAVVNAVLGAFLLAVSNAALDLFEARESPIVELARNVLFSLLSWGAIGMTLALVAHAWPHYTLARSVLAARGRLPWRLQAFLADAHRLGLLRRVGPLYQFRHARLQNHLAGAVVPPARTPPARNPGGPGPDGGAVAPVNPPGGSTGSTPAGVDIRA